MTATIKVHASVMSGYVASGVANGRHFAVSGETADQAAQKVALRLVGAPIHYTGEEVDEDVLSEFGVRVKHARSERDVEIYEMEAAS